MYRKIIGDLEERVRAHRDSPCGRGVLDQLEQLARELDSLAVPDRTRATRIANLIDRIAQQAALCAPDAEKERSFAELRAEIRGMEASWPRLTETVNRVCLLFSALGV